MGKREKKRKKVKKKIKKSQKIGDESQVLCLPEWEELGVRTNATRERTEKSLPEVTWLYLLQCRQFDKREGGAEGSCRAVGGKWDQPGGGCLSPP